MLHRNHLILDLKFSAPNFFLPKFALPTMFYS